MRKTLTPEHRARIAASMRTHWHDVGTRDVSQRFWEKVAPASVSGCRLWTGTLTDAGYGQFWLDGRMVGAHRWAFEEANGPIPAGMQLDHLCRAPACVWPAHLEVVTPWENTRRGRRGVLHEPVTACVNGHEYTPENTYIKPRGGRYCRTCHREAAIAAYRR